MIVRLLTAFAYSRLTLPFHMPLRRLIYGVMAILIVTLGFSYRLYAGTASHYYDGSDRLVRSVLTIDGNLTAVVNYGYDAAGNMVTYKVQTDLNVGDVNGDDKIDLADAVVALKVLSFVNQTIALKAADANGDERIGMAEALFILQTIAQLR